MLGKQASLCLLLLYQWCKAGFMSSFLLNFFLGLSERSELISLRANPQNITVTWIIFKNWTRDMKPDLRMQQSSAKKEWVSACFSAAFIDEILRRNCKKHCSIKQHSLKSRKKILPAAFEVRKLSKSRWRKRHVYHHSSSIDNLTIGSDVNFYETTSDFYTIDVTQ